MSRLGGQAVLGARVRGGALKILPDRTYEFRLGAVAIDDAGIRLQPVHHQSNGRRLGAMFGEAVPEAAGPVLEAGLLRARGG